MLRLAQQVAKALPKFRYLRWAAPGGQGAIPGQLAEVPHQSEPDIGLRGADPLLATNV
jgi:hypothetical protein